MKKLFVILFLIITYQYSFSYYCCLDITVSEAANDTCCLLVTLTNPLCDSLFIEFYQKPTSGGTYVSKHTVRIGKNQSTSFTFCPDTLNTVYYRIQVKDPTVNTIPYCDTDRTFDEGMNQFTNTVDLSYCCPCPDDVDDWLKVVVVKSSDCVDDGCKVAFSLDIPDDITCFSHYVLEKPDLTMSSVKSIESDALEDQGFCLENNESGLINVYLLKHELQDLDSACILSAPVTCDSNTFNPDSTAGPCQPDCTNEEWQGPDQKYYDLGSGCKIVVEYWWRRACPPINYQDIQITKIDASVNCAPLTFEEVYQKALYKVIQDNYMDFNPMINDTICYDIWRVIEASCWMYVETSDTSGYIQITLVPCEESECCLQGMEVCRDLSNNLDIETIGDVITPDSSNCIIVADSLISFPPLIPPYICFAICDWLHFDIYNASHEKASLNIDFNERNYIIRQRENDISVIINCGDIENCNIKIEIYDIYGRQIKIFNESSFLKSKEISLSSDIKSSGVYLFKLFIDGRYVDSDKFIK